MANLTDGRRGGRGRKWGGSHGGRPLASDLLNSSSGRIPGASPPPNRARGENPRRNGSKGRPGTCRTGGLGLHIGVDGFHGRVALTSTEQIVKERRSSGPATRSCVFCAIRRSRPAVSCTSVIPLANPRGGSPGRSPWKRGLPMKAIPPTLEAQGEFANGIPPLNETRQSLTRSFRSSIAIVTRGAYGPQPWPQEPGSGPGRTARSDDRSRVRRRHSNGSVTRGSAVLPVAALVACGVGPPASRAIIVATPAGEAMSPGLVDGPAVSRWATFCWYQSWTSS
jgi:hypothetical protein